MALGGLFFWSLGFFVFFEDIVLSSCLWSVAARRKTEWINREEYSFDVWISICGNEELSRGVGRRVAVTRFFVRAGKSEMNLFDDSGG